MILSPTDLDKAKKALVKPAVSTEYPTPPAGADVVNINGKNVLRSDYEKSLGSVGTNPYGDIGGVKPGTRPVGNFDGAVGAPGFDIKTFGKFTETQQQLPVTQSQEQIDKMKAAGGQFINGEWVMPKNATNPYAVDSSLIGTDKDPNKGKAGRYVTVNGQPIWVPEQSVFDEKTGVVTPWEEMTDRQKKIYELKRIGASEESIRIAGLTDEEYAAEQIKQREADKKKAQELSAMEEKIALAKLNEARRQSESAVSAVKSQYKQSQEGAISSTPSGITGGFENTTNERMKQAMDQFSIAQQRVKNAEEAQQRAIDSGDMQLAADLAKDIDREKANFANAENNLLITKENQVKISMDLLKQYKESGVLSGMSEDEISKLSQTLSNLPTGVVNAMYKSAISASQASQLESVEKGFKTFTDLAKEGIVMPEGTILKYSQQYGIPAEMLLEFNQKASQIKDKNSDEFKALEAEYDRKARGVIGADLEKYDYIQGMVTAGKLTSSEANDLMATLGLDPNKNEMNRIERDLKQAQANIENKKARGEPITIEDKLKELELDKKLKRLQGMSDTSGAYIPNAPKDRLTVSYKDGELSVGNVASSYQCGAFVNRVWGLSSAGTEGMGDYLSDKMRIADYTAKDAQANPGAIKPGMAFITSGGYVMNGKDTGHTGLVATAPDAQGNFWTIEANADGKGNVEKKQRNINDVNMRGFAEPPKGKYTETTPQSVTNEYEDLDENQQKMLYTMKGDFRKDNKAYYDSYDSFGRIMSSVESVDDNNRTAVGTAAGDLSLVYQYMKMLDPGSTVREGEFANAQNSAGIPDQIRNMYNKAVDGTRLNDTQRYEFLSKAKDLYDSKRQEFEKNKEYYQTEARNAGIQNINLYDPEQMTGTQTNSSDIDSYLDNVTSKADDPYESYLSSLNL